eukprot:362262-Chlamydomonas_euryale.AAC.1
MDGWMDGCMCVWGGGEANPHRTASDSEQLPQTAGVELVGALNRVEGSGRKNVAQSSHKCGDQQPPHAPAGVGRVCAHRGWPRENVRDTGLLHFKC